LPASPRPDGAADTVPTLRRPRRRWPIVLLLAVGAAALLTAIAFIAVGEEGESIEITGVNETNQLLGGIRQDGPALGSPEAEVTVSFFNDLQCRPCADYHLETVPPLVEDLVRDGEAGLEFRNFSVGPRETGVSSYAAVAAGEQEREWQFIHLTYLNLDEAGAAGITDELLDAIAGAADLDADEWEEDRASAAVRRAVEADAELAAELELPAQPAVVVDGPGGTRTLVESPPLEEIEEAIAAVR
jgi:protein-disulfide isomerase